MTPGQRLWLESAYRQAIEAEEKIAKETPKREEHQEPPETDE